jgi:hypothetical protein
VLSFDPDGEASLSNRHDVHVMQLYKQNPRTVVSELKKTDPYTLTKFLDQYPGIGTIIFDSMTMFANMALLEAVDKNRSGRNTISLEQPSMAGYAYRNSVVLQVAHNMLALTARLGRSIIFTTHEGSPELDDAGNVQSITMILSTNLANQIGLRISEVWHLRDVDGKERRISVRPHLRMKPMKTRMFLADRPDFVWRYNADTDEGQTINEWWRAWQANDGNKIPLPHVLPTSTTTTGGAKK